MCDVKSQVVQTIQFPVFSLQCMSEYVSVCVGVCVCECAGMWKSSNGREKSGDGMFVLDLFPDLYSSSQGRKEKS